MSILSLSMQFHLLESSGQYNRMDLMIQGSLPQPGNAGAKLLPIFLIQYNLSIKGNDYERKIFRFYWS